MPRAKLLAALSVVFLLGALTPYLARTAEDKPREIPARKVAYIDIGKVSVQCKSYQEALDRMKQDTLEIEEKFKSEYNEMKEFAEALKKLPERSAEHKAKASELGKMELDYKFRVAAFREKFEARLNKVRYTLFERIEKISHRVCDQYDIGLLLQHNTSMIKPRDPKDVLHAINNNIVFADPRLDLSSQVLAELDKLSPLEEPENIK